jgi:PAS domain-containing protein
MASLGGVITVDLNGVITFINRVASELSGLETGKSVGDLIEDVFEIRNGKRKASVETVDEGNAKNEVLLLDNITAK